MLKDFDLGAHAETKTYEVLLVPVLRPIIEVAAAIASRRPSGARLGLSD